MADGKYDPLTYRFPRTLQQAWPDRWDHTQNWSSPNRRMWWTKPVYSKIIAAVITLLIVCHLLYNVFGRAG